MYERKTKIGINSTNHLIKALSCFRNVFLANLLITLGMVEVSEAASDSAVSNKRRSYNREYIINLKSLPLFLFINFILPAPFEDYSKLALN